MTDPNDKPNRHTVADHRLGSDLAHVHDGDADHDHDDFVDGPIEDNPLWIADNVTLTSVGIDIDTGVVILTGEALRRDNAQAIAGLLAEQGGDFVTATAGHHMEAMLAGYGSGAARISSDQGKRILNIDIGGGTTKLALVENGRVTATAAIHIGGRLQVVDDNGRIVRLDPAGQHHAAQAGFHWHKGDGTEPAALDKVADTMAD